MACKGGKENQLLSNNNALAQKSISSYKNIVAPKNLLLNRECVHRHAIKNKIKNYAADKVKKL